ncbi:unnamed protein product [Lepeophtheirus salmonis]|uniref:(salmon louse) hypothetical protein n=1 Tax=Lepeophtheirus salmonis TaxID=72036 RepID=A0A7R8CB74_LEPSM|nr:unnamed protein product [Lepeophtheirus salmonis]CAF2757906.1 unnamed protein product [Lepeophtheirus salmonis]
MQFSCNRAGGHLFQIWTEQQSVCVTDNGSNFLKEFKDFHQVEPESDEEQEEEASEVNFTDLHNVLTTATDNHDGHIIFDKWLASHPDSRTVYRSAIGKCVALRTMSINFLSCIKVPGRAIKQRFAATLDSKDVFLAAVLLPKFKLRRVSEKTRKEYIKFLLTKENCSLLEEPPTLMPDPHLAAAAPQ